MGAEARLKKLGIVLPQASAPVANYVNAVRAGNLLFLAGKGPPVVDGKRPSGKVGREFTVDQAYQHARSTGLELLAAMRAELGSLDRVKRVVKLLGMVNAVPDFTDQPKVINGCSDLFVEVFGDAGRHARSAVGMGSLPLGIPVEIEAIVEIAVAPVRKTKAAGKNAAARSSSRSCGSTSAPRSTRGCRRAPRAGLPSRALSSPRASSA